MSADPWRHPRTGYGSKLAEQSAELRCREGVAMSTDGATTRTPLTDALVAAHMAQAFARFEAHPKYQAGHPLPGQQVRELIAHAGKMEGDRAELVAALQIAQRAMSMHLWDSSRRYVQDGQDGQYKREMGMICAALAKAGAD